MSKGPGKPQVKSDRYSTKDDTDELEVITDKLALDLRKSIRQLVTSLYFICLISFISSVLLSAFSGNMSNLIGWLVSND